VCIGNDANHAHRVRSGGFTIVELVITMTILLLLLYLGIPAFGAFIQNSRLRAAADVFLAGLQQARTEAVRRNAPVEFLLTDNDPDAGNVDTAAASASGRNWLIRVLDPVTGLYTLIEGKSYLEGSGKAAGEAPSVKVSGGVASITFNGLGQANLGGQASFQFINPAGGLCAPAGPMRCINIVVSSGGQVRMCDPAVTAASDTRRC
jgi:type IV fimbrial biogenesis protein FimT